VTDSIGVVVSSHTLVAVLLAHARPELPPEARRRLLADGEVLLDEQLLTEPTAEVAVRDGAVLRLGASTAVVLRTRGHAPR
jgi:glyoxylase-like metal-dependent hydrolase (beta-lactamase superfamily II)